MAKSKTELEILQAELKELKANLEETEKKLIKREVELKHEEELHSNTKFRHLAIIEAWYKQKETLLLSLDNQGHTKG